MKYTTLKQHLRPYVMLSRRRTTINHAFAAAIAPHDTFDDEAIRECLISLGQKPDEGLTCAYCGAAAQTWDHVHATVEKGNFSGWGHRIGNLLPCCKPCNSQKGNRPWEEHLSKLPMSDDDRVARTTLIANYLSKYARREWVSDPLNHQLTQLRDQVLSLLAEGDKIAARIRERQAEKSLTEGVPSTDRDRKPC